MQVLLRVLAFSRAALRDETFAGALDALAADPLSIGLVQLAVGAVLVVAIVLREGGLDSWKDTLSVAPMSKRALGVLFLAGPPLQIVLSELENLARLAVPTPESVLVAQRHLLESPEPLHRLGLFFAVVLVAPITEELLFRSVVQRSLSERFSGATAVLGASAIFGLCHGPIFAAMTYAIVGGVLLGGVFRTTKTVVASIALHASVNATPLLLPSNLVRIPGVNGYSAAVEHVPLPLLGVSILALLACFWSVSRLTGDESDDEDS